MNSRPQIRRYNYLRLVWKWAKASKPHHHLIARDISLAWSVCLRLNWTDQINGLNNLSLDTLHEFQSARNSLIIRSSSSSYRWLFQIQNCYSASAHPSIQWFSETRNPSIFLSGGFIEKKLSAPITLPGRCYFCFTDRCCIDLTIFEQWNNIWHILSFTATNAHIWYIRLGWIDNSLLYHLASNVFNSTGVAIAGNSFKIMSN